MATSGRKLLLVFVAGFLGASLLFALPLVTMRDRVTDLEQEKSAYQEATNSSAADQLLQAEEILEPWPNASGPSPLLEAAARVDAAQGLIDAEPDPTKEAQLDGAQAALTQAATGLDCGMVDASELQAVSELGEHLGLVAENLRQGEPPTFHEAQASAARIQTGLEAALTDHAKIGRALVMGDEARVEVKLDGQIPSEPCLQDLRVEACLADASSCTREQGTDLLADREGPWLGAPTPDLATGAELTVRVSSEVAGVESEDERTTGVHDWPLNGSTLARGEGSQIEDEQVRVIEDQGAWETLWSHHSGGEEAPVVDFEERVVVGIFLGGDRDGCRSLVVDKGGLDLEGNVVVEAVSVERAASFCHTGGNSPFHVWTLDQPSGSIRVDVARR